MQNVLKEYRAIPSGLADDILLPVTNHYEEGAVEYDLRVDGDHAVVMASTEGDEARAITDPMELSDAASLIASIYWLETDPTRPDWPEEAS